MSNNEAPLRHARTFRRNAGGVGTVLATILICATVLAVPVSRADSISDERDTPEPLWIAISGALFDNVNANDARASMAIWIETMARRAGIAVEAKVEVYDDVRALGRAVADSRADLLAVSAKEFLRLDAQGIIEPSRLIERRGETQFAYVLLVRADGPVRTVQDLAQRPIIVEAAGTTNSMAREWLDIILFEAGIGEGQARPPRFKEVRTASSAVLPVFFGQAEACVVSQSAFETMVELNPQLARELVTLVVSPPVAGTMVCVRKGLSARLRSVVEDEANRVLSDPADQQFNLIFQFDSLQPYRPELLESARTILRTWDSIFGHQVQGQASAVGNARNARSSVPGPTLDQASW